MRIGFIGCVVSSERFLELLCSIKEEDIQVVGVVTLHNAPINSDHRDLSPLSKRYDVPYIFHKQSKLEATRNFLRGIAPDVIYCFGWSYLLDEVTLSIAPLGVIGFHPAKLPENRGRHPIIWALALGLKETASTFFKMDSGADSGAILSQENIEITPDDNASTLYAKILTVAEKQVYRFTIDLAKGTHRLEVQDQKQATYWRKRSRKDGLIDWRMHADTVNNLVRALTRPYPGAEFIYKDNYVQVWDSEVEEIDYPSNVEPGRVLEVNSQYIVVKCAEVTAIRIKNMNPKISLQIGDYL